MRRFYLLIVIALFALGLGRRPDAFATDQPPPRRRNEGDLIILEVSGTYEEMGRQQAELLGDELRRVYDLQLAAHARALGRSGWSDTLLDAVGFPLWSAFGGGFEDSSFHAELAGIAAGLGVSRVDVMRALLALGGGSTVFAATRSATADGQALIGRNVDWDDLLGALRPVVVHYRPSNGDLDHLAAGWPLVGLPTVGVNAAGFALSFNYFETDPQVGLWLPQWPHRRALQTARNVAEGIEVFVSARQRGISCFMVMADAAGDLAMVECTPSRCSVFRPQGDWFGHANHARTPEMLAFDRYRSPDSFDRQRGIETAVERFVGALTPHLAVEVLRDRSTHAWPNASNVANLAVLNAAVVHPASRTLWHATSAQPVAPFGSYVGVALGGDGAVPPTIPASAWFGTPGMKREVAAVAEARAALHDLSELRYAAARQRFQSVLAERPPVLDPQRIALGSAYAALRAGDAAAAFELALPSSSPDAPTEVRIYAMSLRAVCADRLGQRQEAARLHGEALALIEANPQWNVFDAVGALAREGIAGAIADRDPIVSYYILRVPF